MNALLCNTMNALCPFMVHNPTQILAHDLKERRNCRKNVGYGPFKLVQPEVERENVECTYRN